MARSVHYDRKSSLPGLSASGAHHLSALSGSQQSSRCGVASSPAESPLGRSQPGSAVGTQGRRAGCPARVVRGLGLPRRWRRPAPGTRRPATGTPPATGRAATCPGPRIQPAALAGSPQALPVDTGIVEKTFRFQLSGTQNIAANVSQEGRSFL